MASGSEGTNKRTLLANEARSHAFLKALPDTLLVLDSKGTVLDYSANERTDLFPADADVVGQNIRDVLPADVANNISRGMPGSLEFSLPKTDGDYFYEVRVVPLETDTSLAIVTH